jgi:hypothetical protein
VTLPSKLDCGINVLCGTDTYWTTRTCHELDVVRQDRAETVAADCVLVRSTDMNESEVATITQTTYLMHDGLCISRTPEFGLWNHEDFRDQAADSHIKIADYAPMGEDYLPCCAS